jgi:hypothetical protein
MVQLAQVTNVLLLIVVVPLWCVNRVHSVGIKTYPVNQNAKFALLEGIVMQAVKTI